MKHVILAALMIILPMKSYGENPNWNGDPEPPDPPPVVVDTPKTSVVDGDSAYDPYGRIYYSICTCKDFVVAWGFESLDYRTNKARVQCEIRRYERLKCPVKWK